MCHSPAGIVFIKMLDSLSTDDFSSARVQVDCASLFGTDPLPLSHMVLLSLINQLGFDLTKEPVTKMTWLREAALSLNPQDPIVAPHAKAVLTSKAGNASRVNIPGNVASAMFASALSTSKTAPGHGCKFW